MSVGFECELLPFYLLFIAVTWTQCNVSVHHIQCV